MKGEIFCDCDVIHAEMVDSVRKKCRANMNYMICRTFQGSRRQHKNENHMGAG